MKYAVITCHTTRIVLSGHELRAIVQLNIYKHDLVFHYLTVHFHADIFFNKYIITF